KQMMQHFYCEVGLLHEEVLGVDSINVKQQFNYEKKQDLFDEINDTILSTLFDGIKKGVFSSAKFDSLPELYFARLCETDKEILKWLRPAPKEFNIKYNNGKQYEPDFVVETNNVIYLVEVKGEDRLSDPDVLAKKNRSVSYCKVATNWCLANGYKPWIHLFIPAKQIQTNVTFKQLAQQFSVK
ncbi:MAG: hypothetical protein RR585_10395, partial [Coprobacillus sp.]